MPRPVHFEIHAADFERAKAFYSGLFGWTFVPRAEDFWMISTGPANEPGIDGGMVKRRGANPDPDDPTPVVGFICTHQVPDVDAYVRKALALGGTVALPKMAIPGVGWLAYVKDTESNIFGMMQTEPAAG